MPGTAQPDFRTLPEHEPLRYVALKLSRPEEAVSVHGMHTPDLNYGISSMVYFRDHDNDTTMRRTGIFGRDPASRVMSASTTSWCTGTVLAKVREQLPL